MRFTGSDYKRSRRLGFSLSETEREFKGTKEKKLASKDEKDLNASVTTKVENADGADTNKEKAEAIKSKKTKRVYSRDFGRSYGPGQHGPNQKRKKLSEYGRQLVEKQKLAQLYGVNERQFRRLFIIAKAKKDVVTGLAFIRILESRLDNLVYRMGFASTRRQARQLVNHGHFLVNGKKVDVPSYLCAVNDVITLRDSSKKLTIVKDNLANYKAVFPTVEVDTEKMTGKFIREIERSEFTNRIDEAQIIEWYNRQL